MEAITGKRRSRISIKPADPIMLTINASMDFESNAAKNRIWYRGDSLELSQLYEMINERTSLFNFWSSKCSEGMEMRKIHTGIPSIIVDTLSKVVLTDMNDINFKKINHEELWEKIAKENNIEKVFENSLKEALYIGDGAFKITFDASVSSYPIIEFYSGDQIEFTINRGRIREVIFRTNYNYKGQTYVLYETYGYGYIKNKLTKDDKEIDLHFLPETKDLSDYAFSGYEEDAEGNVINKGVYMLAVPVMIYQSEKYKGRGKSIFDKKIDSFDALDEAWSQWMDALRSGRTREYIPDSLIPRDPETGRQLKPNAFDNRFIKIDSDMSENAKNEISLQQPDIPHESYEATYCTALDLCLQGLISPSTIGIDVKKLDNAEAQREKEKTTLYTRNDIVETWTEIVKALVENTIAAYEEINKMPVSKVEADVSFGEYANPSFESQVETIGKAKTQNIMSIEACVDELYGDTKDDEWKKMEVARLKAEQGIVDVEEPGVNMAAGNFNVNLEGDQNAGKGGE